MRVPCQSFAYVQSFVTDDTYRQKGLVEETKSEFGLGSSGGYENNKSRR